MSSKQVIERSVIIAFNEMCIESLYPDLCVVLIDEIIPCLLSNRHLGSLDTPTLIDRKD